MRNLSEARTTLTHLEAHFPTLPHFEVLKRNKRLKKLILSILSGAKLLRTTFNDLRSRYEGAKLKLKTLPKYKAL